MTCTCKTRQDHFEEYERDLLRLRDERIDERQIRQEERLFATEWLIHYGDIHPNADDRCTLHLAAERLRSKPFILAKEPA